MTKREFLDKLKKALVNDLSGSVIQENVNYYNDYITEEVRKGRRESDVIEELGGSMGNCEEYYYFGRNERKYTGII